MHNANYQKIWKVVTLIPEGRVASYGQVADLAGLPGRARLVSRALQAAPAGAGSIRVSVDICITSRLRSIKVRLKPPILPSFPNLHHVPIPTNVADGLTVANHPFSG